MTNYSPTPTTVVCRVHPGLWFIALAIAAHGTVISWIIAHSSTTKGGTPAQGAAIVAVSSGFALLMLCLALLRIKVTGDDNGLTWTGFLSTNHANWRQVRSVGEVNMMGKRVIRVETENGNFTMNSSLTNKDAMVALIQSRIGTPSAFGN